MKLLYIHNADFSSFSANKIQVINSCNAFFENDVDVTLLAFQNNSISNGLLNKKIKLIFLKSKFNYYMRTLILFITFIKINKKYKNIFTRDLIFSYLILIFYSKKKIIYELHDIYKKPIWIFFFNIVFKKIKYLVVISEGLKEDLIALGYDSKKIIILHDGVDLRKFDISISKLESRKKLNLPLNKKIITYVGSFQKWKGFDLLLEVAKLTNIDSEKCYLFVGGNTTQIINLKKKNLKNIIFTGLVNNDEVPLYLKASDILILPNSANSNISIKYTSPLKLFEYLASKRPVIASNLPSINNIVSSKEVLYFKPDNSNSLIIKIDNLLNNQKLNLILVKNSFKLVKNFEWKIRTKKIISLYKK